ncbi:MAG: GGDEF domain-containing protein [Actinomycetota bacterium]|nr:GGDEF domain-containing protein [Actinomycetota bacterium]
MDRRQAVDDRARASVDREAAAAARDEFEAEAEQRTASRRQAAADRERTFSDRRQTGFDRDHSRAEAQQRASDRGQAADDRRLGVADREQATADRAEASLDRELAKAELRNAQIDHLTGAYGRELGIVALEREIDRARRGDSELVLAYVDVDGLKQVNDRKGHAAGDALLRDVVAAIQSNLRSYDPVVRVGGDEFVCMLTDSSPTEARRRFQQIQTAIVETQAAASVSVGFAQLRPDDTLVKLAQRGDRALRKAKRAKGGGGG